MDRQRDPLEPSAPRRKHHPPLVFSREQTRPIAVDEILHALGRPATLGAAAYIAATWRARTWRACGSRLACILDVMNLLVRNRDVTGTRLSRVRETFVALALLGCGSGSSGPPTAEKVLPAAEPRLSDAAFATQWIWRDHLSIDRPIDAVTRREDGSFVAISRPPTCDGKGMPVRSNIVALSTDGRTWRESGIGDIDGRSVAAGNGVVVIAGHRWAGPETLPGVVLTSADGSTWSETVNKVPQLMTVRFVNGKFWALGAEGALLSSPDGRRWEDQSRPELVVTRDIAFGKGRYVLIATSGWLSSTDGKTWTMKPTICDDVALCPGAVPPGGTPPGSLEVHAVAFGNGSFVADGRGTGWVSDDGRTWSGAAAGPARFQYSRGQFFGVNINNEAQVLVSEDGRAWTPRTTIVRSYDSRIGCDDRACIPFPNGLLIAANPGDAPIPIPDAIALDAEDDGRTIAAVVDQQVRVWLQTIGPGNYGAPELDSDAVRVTCFGSPPYANLDGPIMSYTFAAMRPGRTAIRIPHTAKPEPFLLTIEVAAPSP